MLLSSLLDLVSEVKPVKLFIFLVLLRDLLLLSTLGETLMVELPLGLINEDLGRESFITCLHASYLTDVTLCEEHLGTLILFELTHIFILTSLEIFLLLQLLFT